MALSYHHLGPDNYQDAGSAWSAKMHRGTNL